MNKLKLIVLSIFSLGAIVVTSCKDDDGTEPEPVIPPTLQAPAESSLSFAVDGGSSTVNVTLVGDVPVVSSGASWCTAELSSSSEDGVHTITVTVPANTSLYSRSGVVKVSYSDSSYGISVKQDGDKVKMGCELKGVYDLGLGWNLGNQLDAWSGGDDETCWGNSKATQATLDAVKAAGFTSVRIPVTWMKHMGAAPDYTIEEAWLNRVAEVVGYAEKAGLKAIVNIHHDGSADATDKYNGWLQIGRATKDADLNEQIKNQIKIVWTQIANKFADKGDFLVFEGFNEIHDGGWGWGDNRNDGGAQYKVFKQWLQVFVDAVRATGGNNATRYLGIPSYDTIFDLAIENFVGADGNFDLPVDPANHLMVAVHNYDPYEYAIANKYTQWGHTADTSKSANDGNEATMRSNYKKLKTNFVEKGIPVYVGEFGSVRRDNATDESFRRYYLEYVCRVAREAGIGMVVWDNGSAKTGNESFGLFDHGTGVFLNDDSKAAVEAMVRGYFADDERYTLETIYDHAPSAK